MSPNDCPDDGCLIHPARRRPGIGVEPGIMAIDRDVVDEGDMVQGRAGFGSRRIAGAVARAVLRRREALDGPIRLIDAESLVIVPVNVATRDRGTGAENGGEIDAALAVDPSARRGAIGDGSPGVRAKVAIRKVISPGGGDDDVATIHRVMRRGPSGARRGPRIAIVAGRGNEIGMKRSERDRSRACGRPRAGHVSRGTTVGQQ